MHTHTYTHMHTRMHTTFTVHKCIMLIDSLFMPVRWICQVSDWSIICNFCFRFLQQSSLWKHLVEIGHNQSHTVFTSATTAKSGAPLSDVIMIKRPQTICSINSLTTMTFIVHGKWLKNDKLKAFCKTFQLAVEQPGARPQRLQMPGRAKTERLSTLLHSNDVCIARVSLLMCEMLYLYICNSLFRVHSHHGNIANINITVVCVFFRCTCGGVVLQRSSLKLFERALTMTILSNSKSMPDRKLQPQHVLHHKTPKQHQFLWLCRNNLHQSQTWTRHHAMWPH